MLGSLLSAILGVGWLLFFSKMSGQKSHV